MSIVLGTTMNAPGRPKARANPGPLGAELTGSGNPVTPCRRMHRESASMLAFSDALAWPPPPKAGMYLAQRDLAALNEGENGLIPFGSWIPPPPLGSGNEGTPFARMHVANSIPCERPAREAVVADEPDEDPHAASASAAMRTSAAVRANGAR